MQSNGYIGLLDSDTILIKHPKKHREIRLHRIIALKTFQLKPTCIQGITDIETAKKHKQLIEKYLDSVKKTYDNFDSLIANAMEKNDNEKVKKLATEKIKCEHELNKLKSEYAKHDKLISDPDSLLNSKTIDIYTIGGYVESLDNLDPDNPVWIDHRGRVFDNAKILDNSHITENCLIFDDAVVINSRIEHYARIHDNAKIESSNIRDLVEIKNNAFVKNSVLENSSMVFENAKLDNCIMSTGTVCRGNSKIKNTIILDTSQIQGDSLVENCILENRSCLLNGEHIGVNFNETIELQSKTSEGEIPRYW